MVGIGVFGALKGGMARPARPDLTATRTGSCARANCPDSGGMPLAFERGAFGIGNRAVQTIHKLSQDDAIIRASAAERAVMSNVAPPPRVYDESPGENARARWPMAIIGFGLLATIVWAGVLVWLVAYLLMKL
jgi:hypothetical protein